MAEGDQRNTQGRLSPEEDTGFHDYTTASSLERWVKRQRIRNRVGSLSNVRCIFLIWAQIDRCDREFFAAYPH
jgi:hypothetical protein